MGWLTTLSKGWYQPRHLRRARFSGLIHILVALALLPLAGLAIQPSASAATSVSMTTMRGEAGIVGDRYDWSMTTGTTATLSKMSMLVKPGTSAPYRYLLAPGVADGEVTTPGTTINQITGDLDIRAAITPNNWASGSTQAIMSKWQGSGSQSWSFQLTGTGNLRLIRSGDGTTTLPGTTDSTLTVPYSGTQPVAVRATLTQNNGSSGNDVKFYYRAISKTTATGISDNGGWTQLGTTLTNSGTTVHYGTSARIEIGAYNNGSATGAFAGKIYYADFRNGVNSTSIANVFNPSEVPATSPTTWTASDSNAEVWTVDRAGSGFNATEIAADLSVASVSGIPSGGNAYLRIIDALVVYQFPTNQAVTSGAVINIGIMGFIDSTTAGASASRNTKTYDASGTQVDSPATTYSLSALTIAAGGGTTSGYSGDGGFATSAQFNSPGQMAADENGNLYIADTGNNVIRKVDQYGNTSTVNLGLTISAPEGLFYDTTNQFLYIADTGNNAIRRYNATTGITTTITSALPSAPKGIVNDLANSYVSTADCRILQISGAGTITTLAGTAGTCTSTGDGSAPASATLKNPLGLALDPTSRIVIAEAGSGSTDGRVRRIDRSAGTITTIAGGGSGTTDDVLATRAQLNAPSAVQVDGTGEVYVSLTGDRDVRHFADGGTIRTLVGSPSASSAGSTGDGGASTSATLTTPKGIAFSNGSVWVSDAGVSKLRTVTDAVPVRPYVSADQVDIGKNQTANTSVLSNDLKLDGEIDYNSLTILVPPSFASAYSVNTSTGQISYTPNLNYVGGDALTYQVCDSTLMQCGITTLTITIGSDNVEPVLGNVQESAALLTASKPIALARFRNYLYFVDGTYNIIRRYDTYSKQTVIVAGTGLYPSSGTINGVPAQYGRFYSPTGIVVTPSGDLYVSDSGGYSVDRVAATTNTLTTIAGTFANGNSADGVSAAGAGTQISSPTAIALGANGTIYVATSTFVRSFTLGGTLNTVAGTSTAGTADGTTGAAGTARFSALIGGLAIDPSNGDMYVADTSNHAVRRISGGNVTTVAGVIGVSGNDNNGTATTIHLNNPYGVMVDSSSNIYVTDTTNSKIRQFTVGGTMNKIAGTGTPGWSADGTAAGSANLNKPQALVLNPSGGYYIADSTGGRIRSSTTFNTAGITSTQVGNGNTGAMAGGSPGTQTQLSRINTTSSNPVSLAVSPNGTIFYIGADKTITRVDGVTGISTTAALPIMSGTGAGNPTFDASGYVLVTAANDNTILRINPTTLAVTTLISSGLGGPRGVAYDSTFTNLYIANASTNQILKWNGSTLSVFAGVYSTANPGADYGDGGPALSAGLNLPWGIQVDSVGNVYFIELNSHRIRMIDTRGIITTLVDNAGTQGYTGDGSQSFDATTGFNSYQLALDPANNVYLADAYNFVVRKIDNNNVISTVAGSGAKGNVYYTASPTAANFGFLKGITTRGSDIYVGDDTAGRVIDLKGLTSNPSSNALAGASWAIVPGASGHASTSQHLVIKPTVDTPTSKLTFSVPAGTTGASPTVSESYGVPTTVSASSPSTNIVTLSFGSSFTMKAGVSYAFTISGLDMSSVPDAAYTSGVTLYDNGGTPAPVGWARSTIATLTSGLPAIAAAGYDSVWAKASSIKVNSGANSTVTVNPNSTTSSASSIVVQSGSGSNDNLNSTNLNVTATAPTSTSPSATITGITANVSVGAALTTTPNRWGTGLTSVSSTGTSAAGLSASNYVGNTGSPQTFVSSANGANIYTLSNGAYIDWLQPAGTYTSTYTFNLNGGS